MSIHRFVLHNDQIREAAEGFLAAGQVGLLSGWGVFSTLRVAGGVLFAFERHWDRMMRDALRMHIPMPGDPAAVRRRLDDLVDANHAPDCTLRVVVVRNGGGMWEGPSTGRASDLMALTAASKNWGQGVRLTIQPEARQSTSEFAGAKILSWGMNLTWLENAQNRGFDEAILLNERGEVTECTSANIFVANGSSVFTPPFGAGCLPGITRELLLSEVRAPGFQVEEKTLLPDDLERADEVFITSTTRDLLPVLSVDGRAMRDLGCARTALQAEFRRYFNEYVAAYIATHGRVTVPA
ncbi:MAG: aminotransferase class IV [Acidobacteriota bacterium]|nr:aminotransferase class IV [Acidobacteriota bacterium]